MILVRKHLISIFCITASVVIAEDSVLPEGQTARGPAYAGAVAGDGTLNNVVTEELAVHDSPVDEQSLDDAIVLNESNGNNLNLEFGASYLYDTNSLLQPEDTPYSGTSVWAFDLGVQYYSGSETAKGAYYGFDYRGFVFAYESATVRAGRDPWEQKGRAVIGLNGGKTRFQTGVFFATNNGNSLENERVNREIGRVNSLDWGFDIDLIRDLPHGSIETGFDYRDTQFDSNTQLNDGTTYSIDSAWFHQPGFTPKTSLGIGFNLLKDNYVNNVNQTAYTPSLRMRYRFSGKTIFYGQYGYQFRKASGNDGLNTEAPNYEYGATWAATSKSTLNVTGYGNVSPSYVSNGENFDQNGVSIGYNQELPWDLSFNSEFGYETASYFPSESEVSTNREDNYYRFGAVLSRQLNLLKADDGEISIFYNYNDNGSNDSFANFKQQILGFRFGLKY